MSTSPGRPNELTNREAVAWFQSIDEYAPNAVDNAIFAMDSAFGDQVRVSAVAPIDSDAEDPVDLFLVLDGDVDDDGAWDRLVAVHRDFLRFVGSRPSAIRSQERIHFVLAHVLDAPELRDVTSAWFDQ